MVKFISLRNRLRVCERLRVTRIFSSFSGSATNREVYNCAARRRRQLITLLNGLFDMLMEGEGRRAFMRAEVILCTTAWEVLLQVSDCLIMGVLLTCTCGRRSFCI